MFTWTYETPRCNCWHYDEQCFAWIPLSVTIVILRPKSSLSVKRSIKRSSERKFKLSTAWSLPAPAYKNYNLFSESSIAVAPLKLLWVMHISESELHDIDWLSLVFSTNDFQKLTQIIWRELCQCHQCQHENKRKVNSRGIFQSLEESSQM